MLAAPLQEVDFSTAWTGRQFFLWGGLKWVSNGADPVDTGDGYCALPPPAVQASPAALAFGATKSGSAGALIVTTPAQTVTTSVAGSNALAWTAASNQIALRPDVAGKANLWILGDALPGPILRLRPGEEFRVRVRNETPAPLSFHWHGMRGPNAVDGAAGLTGVPADPGQVLEYSFIPPESERMFASAFETRSRWWSISSIQRRLSRTPK